MYPRSLIIVAGAAISLALIFFVKAQLNGEHRWYPSHQSTSLKSGPIQRHGVVQVSSDGNAAQTTSAPSNAVDALDGVIYSVREHVTNSTLGFEKILAVGLAERSDRRDQLTLMTSYQNVKLTWMEAVKGENIDKKAYPPHWNTGGTNFSLGALGCWRSHMNALRSIVEEGYSTALIIEDDADWDIDLKEQLLTYANITRKLGNDLRSADDQVTAATVTHSPYGDHWDLLWLGSCANPPGPDNSHLFDGKGGQVHWVWREKTNGMACTYGYAVTFESARELLSLLQDIDKPYDLVLGGTCPTRECVVTWPELIGMYHAAGSSIKDSNIEPKQPGVRNEGYTPHIVDSAMLNAFERISNHRKLERPSTLGHAEQPQEESVSPESSPGEAITKDLQ